jgi:chromosome segregation ATPase
VDIRRLQTVPGGDVIHGTVWSRAGTFPNVILRRGDVEIYQGSALSDTTRQHRELVSRRAERMAAIEERKRELANAEAIRNPHQQEYRKVLREYKRIADESTKLKSEFDDATGNRRMELANRLRVLKNEQANLMPRYQDLKQKKEDWDAENREEDRPRDPGRDPRIEQWNREIRELDEQIRDTSTSSRENDDG